MWAPGKRERGACKEGAREGEVTWMESAEGEWESHGNSGWRSTGSLGGWDNSGSREDVTYRQVVSEYGQIQW